MSFVLAIARNQLRILRRDPGFLVIMFLMPLAVMPLFQRMSGLGLATSGFDEATGAELVVPGQAVLFGFFVAGSAGFSVFREHGWKTWDRLRASSASSRALLAGYAIPWIAVHVIYQVALFVAGFVFLGLRFDGGSPVASLLVMMAFSTVAISLVLLMTATFRTINQVNALVNVGAMIMGGLGGAMVPKELLPGWAQTVSPLFPTYWAMEGHRSIFLEQGGVNDVVVPVFVMMGMAAVLTLLAARRFRADETKEFFA